MIAGSHSLPSWVMNLIGFGLLIALVLAAFFWQMVGMDRELHRNTLGRTRMMAAIIEENLANAELAATTIDTLTTSFLRDKARFVEYLTGIDPLQPEELAALARETGLIGIIVRTQDGKTASGPDHWLDQSPDCRASGAQVRYDAARQTALLTYPGTTAGIDCILVGLDAHAVMELRGKTALPVLLDKLSRLPGIHYVCMDPEQGRQLPDTEPVRLLTTDARVTAEARLTTAKGVLVVGLDATGHFSRLRQLQRQFFFFAALLFGLGVFFSWLLYRYQQLDIERTRRFERLLAKEHEAAALGRATETIAHEVRNPLNAISMGLQRLQLESPGLDAEQHQLIAAMTEAVQRAGLIITGLQRFTRRIKPRQTPLDPTTILERILTLYRPSFERQQIALLLSPVTGPTLATDGDLLAELLENLIRNSLEAQPQGGFLHITHTSVQGQWLLSLTNGGYLLDTAATQRLGEPYFTTKTRGTGLGLALCRKIAEALGGELRFAADHQRRHLTVQLALPNQP